jgi:rhamnosyl/mannosyltransferase
MKIMHIGKYYPPYRGGMETVLENMAEGLLDAGCGVTVLVAGAQGLDTEEVLTGPVTGWSGRLVRAAVHGHCNSQPLTLGLVGTMRRELARQRPDVVHLHLPNPLAAAAWLALDTFPDGPLPRLAVWYHADITRQRLGKILAGPVVRRCLGKSVGISVSSAALKAGSPVLAPLADKVAVIPFGIDPAPWCEVEPGGDGPFLFIGRLVPYKGLENLIAAVGMVPEAELVIMGEGPLAEALRQLAADSGCRGRVLLTGAASRREIAANLGRARALVLPSLDASETFGLVQLEAMAAGVPVIASDLPTGVREVGEPGVTCRLVKPGDPVALADVMRGMVQDPQGALAMGAAGRRRFEKLYTRGMMVDRLSGWYDSLLTGSKGDSL